MLEQNRLMRREMRVYKWVDGGKGEDRVPRREREVDKRA